MPFKHHAFWNTPNPGAVRQGCSDHFIMMPSIYGDGLSSERMDNGPTDITQDYCSADKYMPIISDHGALYDYMQREHTFKRSALPRRSYSEDEYMSRCDL